MEMYGQPKVISLMIWKVVWLEVLAYEGLRVKETISSVIEWFGMWNAEMSGLHVRLPIIVGQRMFKNFTADLRKCKTWIIFNSKGTDPPHTNQILELFTQRVKVLGGYDLSPMADVSSKPKHTSSFKPSKVFSARSDANKIVQCSLCKEEGHHIQQCFIFKSWDVEKRKQHVSINKLFSTTLVLVTGLETVTTMGGVMIKVRPITLCSMLHQFLLCQLLQ